MRKNGTESESEKRISLHRPRPKIFALWTLVVYVFAPKPLRLFLHLSPFFWFTPTHNSNKSHMKRSGSRKCWRRFVEDFFLFAGACVVRRTLCDGFFKMWRKNHDSICLESRSRKEEVRTCSVPTTAPKIRYFLWRHFSVTGKAEKREVLSRRMGRKNAVFYDWFVRSTAVCVCVLSEKPADYESYCLREEAIIAYTQHTNRQTSEKAGERNNENQLE